MSPLFSLLTGLVPVTGGSLNSMSNKGVWGPSGKAFAPQYKGKRSRREKVPVIPGCLLLCVSDAGQITRRGIIPTPEVRFAKRVVLPVPGSTTQGPSLGLKPVATTDLR